MVDFFGKEVHVGDEVVYLMHFKTSSDFKTGVVEKVTEKCAFINGKRKEGHKIINLSAIKNHD